MNVSDWGGALPQAEETAWWQQALDKAERAGELVVDGSKQGARALMEASNALATTSGQTTAREVQAQQAVSQEVGGALADAGAVVAEVVTYQGPVLAPVSPEAGPSPFLVVEPKAAIQAEAGGLELIADALATAGPLGTAARQSGGIQVLQGAAPLAGLAPQVVLPVAALYTFATTGAPLLLRPAADLLEELSQGMDDPTDDTSYDWSDDCWCYYYVWFDEYY